MPKRATTQGTPRTPEPGWSRREKLMDYLRSEDASYVATLHSDRLNVGVEYWIVRANVVLVRVDGDGGWDVYTSVAPDTLDVEATLEHLKAIVNRKK